MNPVGKFEAMWAHTRSSYMRNYMQLYRADTGDAIPPTDFPDLIAVCRSSIPFLQFQILSLDQRGHVANGSRHYAFVEQDRIRNLNFVLENHENGRRDRPYMVGQIDAVNPDTDHYHGPVRARFEVRRIFLESQNMRIPVVFIDPMSVLPQPKNLVVPLNVERREREDNQFNHLLQNEVLNPNNYSRRINIPRFYDDDNYINGYRDFYFNRDNLIRPDDDSDDERTRRRRRNRVVGVVPSTPPIVRPRGDEPAAAASAPSPTVQLSNFTVNAILNQAMAEEMTCPISMGKIDKNTAAVTTCQHVFQRESIARWLVDHDTCPVCRARTTVVQLQVN